MYCLHHPGSWSQMKSLESLLFCRLPGKLWTKNPRRLLLKPKLSSPAEAGRVAMLSTILFGCFTFFDLFALFVTCFTVSVENVDPITVSEAREPIPADSGSGRRLASTLLNANWCCLPRLCAGKSLSDIVREQSVQAHVALARLSFELFSDLGTIWSAGDNHEASQHRMLKK